ncbi:vacuolar carboxypeptidase Cps1 [Lepidopterella palustris CBS 459.81]|uniref:Vacuolar carboxypeptidase Cps1 n=1 Tax=Lepidopterella palustris CBS 459.81 TaxID=1314670 RepID=A0A8E2JHY0_9PEZI|nr:vacuolar carboxypeptidase Cps1 [Lepidopterella palustris CBS 459.81]
MESKYVKRLAVFVGVAFILLLILFATPSARQTFNSNGQTKSTGKGGVESWCPLAAIPSPADDGLDRSSRFMRKDAVEKQVERLSAAVNVATVSYDDNQDVGVDPRWEIFGELHKVLKDQFPLVHEKLKLDKINTYGLIYTLKGTSKDLKPVMFTAHQDVVPANSPDNWKYPPFSAHYDGQWLWGRGSSDCKNNLIGLLSVMEDLVSQNWQPKRTIVLAFGFDEEIGGHRGAAYISAEIEKKYGKQGIAMIADEGGMGLKAIGGTVYALPAVAEKGYMDVVLKVQVEGGHSSRPPRHSGIGIIAEMIVELEAHPFEPKLTQENPYRGVLECEVKHSPGGIEPWLRRALVKNEDESLTGIRLAEARGNEVRFLLQTSQAVDVINGGDKTNQLPESVTAVVNYRIAPHDTLNDVKASIAKLLKPIAHKYQLSVRGFGLYDNATGLGVLELDSRDDLSPSPISPTDPSNPVWNLFSGTIRQVFESTTNFSGKTVVPVGDIMTGNTDTINYWNLSRNIYRFTPARAGTRVGVHTVDERMDMNAHVEGMRVYYELMRNFDGVEDA